MAKPPEVALKPTGSPPSLAETHPIFGEGIPDATSPPDRGLIASLVQGFAANIKAYKSPEIKEAAIRLQFIDKFWEALGWDVANSRQLSPSDVEVIVEKNVETAEPAGLRSRRPDYIFRLGGFPRFVVEAKKPIVDIDDDKQAIFQAKQYAWNSTIPFAILTDFEQFRLFDTTLSPVFNDPRRGLIHEFSLDYNNYEAQWQTLAATFGRASVEAGSLERLLATVKKLRPGRRIRAVDRTLIDLKGAEPVDQAFLAYLDAHRRHIAADIYRENKSSFPEADTFHGAARLTAAVQRIMDRLVFMRVIEDRDIAPYGTLRDMLGRIGAEGGEFYEALCAAFRDYDAKYNGYLYKPHFSEELKVDGNVLADFTRTLYPPDGPWDFAAIGDDILGIVYERFLGNIVTVQQNQATIEPKPEVRHAGGVYYTPRFIVDSIIRRVIGPQIEGKTPAQVLDVKILDPACGSGSFLVVALQYLFDYCLNAVHTDPALAQAVIPALSESSGPKGRKAKSEIAFQDARGQWHLAPDFRAALLTRCIHGVDIDQQAVEVTVMSLYLKMLESKLPENWATLWVERQLLPILDHNIRCGNSLIDEESYFRFREKQGRNQILLYDQEDADTRFRINRFDWKSHTRGFGRIFDPQFLNPGVILNSPPGFDCIIGNPPYIRVQELNKWAPEECEFYKWNYKSAAKGNYDIYVVFTEKALSLLTPNGLLGFIMPHKFWQAQYGEGLRGLVADGRHLRSIVDFGDQQVFKGATTYTAIHIFSQKPHPDGISYAKILELEDGGSQFADLDAGKRPPGSVRFRSRAPTGTGPWVFSNARTSSWLAALRGNLPTLGDIAPRIAQGLVSGCDAAFYLKANEKGYSSTLTGRTHAIEKGLIRPLLKGSVHIRRWAMDKTQLSVLFPYRRAGGDWRLIEPEAMQTEFPLAYAYLMECRAKLVDREKTERKNEKGEIVRARGGRPEFDRPFDGPDFYRFSRPQNFDVMPLPKLLVPAMAQRGEYAIDERGRYFFVGSGGGGGGAYAIVPRTKIDLKYLCGLLNSKLLDTFLRRVTTPFHSGWFAYSKAYISQIPIKLPETAAEKKLAERITLSVRTIMDAKTTLNNAAGSLRRSSSLSDQEQNQLESTIEAHEKRIDEAVFALYGVTGLPE